MISFLNNCNFEKSVFNEILYEKVAFLKCNFKKKYILILFLNYLNKAGNKVLAESIIYRLLFLLKKTSLTKNSILFSQQESCLCILNQAFINVMPSFKLIIKNKKEYTVVSFQDLIKDHSILLNKQQFTDSKNSNNKNSFDLFNIITVIPVPLDLNNRCLKGCTFLFKSAVLHKNSFDFASKLYEELLLAYYSCGRSVYLKNEIDKIACIHRSNIKF